MEINEYIESGILELYVYGMLSESENIEIAQLAKQNDAIAQEIDSIEKAILSLSSSFSPTISNEVFEKTKAALQLKHQTFPVKKLNYFNYLGWAASIVLLVGIGYQFFQLNNTKEQILVVVSEKEKLKDSVNNLELNNRYTKEILAIVRDENNKVIPLGGQTVAPEAKAKIYWNQATDKVYVDASGLPEPPEGKVYQVWSLKLQPQLTPTSIGLLADFKSNDIKIFAVDKTTGAEAFGITLEPAGGSASPTLEQLYTLGKV